MGNARISFSDLNGNGQVDVPTEILQENHYYPFGMAQKGPWMNNISAEDNKYTYNGKEMNEDFGLGLYDYGARWYDGAIGRFTSVDRYSEKYNPMTPYQYGANNPIKYIDVNGDSIYIYSQKDKKAIIYHDGKLFWARTGQAYDGKAYNKKGDLTGFVKQTSSALDKIRTGGGAGKELINYFQNDKFKNIRIEFGTSNNNKSGLISWNPNDRKSDIQNQDGSFGRDPFIGLAHEIAHSWDLWENSNENVENLWYSTGGTDVTQSELVATWWENRIRAENNVGLREFYSFANNNGRLQGEEAGRLLIPSSRYSKHINMIGGQIKIAVGLFATILYTPYKY